MHEAKPNTGRKPLRVPALLYDTLEQSAIAYEGIGAGDYWRIEGTVAIPHCVWGHAYFTGLLGGYTTPVPQELRERAERLIAHPVMSIKHNDGAVRAINDRKGALDRQQKVTWEEYCAERRIIRGPDVDA